MTDHPLLCPANYSEGRRAEVIDDVARAGKPCVLHLYPDRDHHRTIATCAGGRELVPAMIAMARRACDLIDLRTHRGGHPRLGAMDVVPFVPLSGSTITHATQAARRFARELADALDIPVFLFGEASSEPRALPEIRARAFVDVAPDFGPAAPHLTAGAVCVGARAPLVAFNVNLVTRSLAEAKAIASEVRETSGGLPGVRALGIELGSRDIVQVSMNLTSLDRTNIPKAYDAVAAAARARGIEIEGSEVAGAAPRSALGGRSREELRLAEFPLLEELLAGAGYSA